MSAPAAPSRLDHLDAARAFALLLGVGFHASLSFMPVFIFWAVQDVATSPAVAVFMTVSHSFRMELFFLLAGFLGWGAVQRKGAAVFLRSRAVRLVVPWVAGWFLLRPLIISGWTMGSASLRGDYDFWGAIGQSFRNFLGMSDPWLTGSHLWFLYYLALVTVLALALRWLADRAGVTSDGGLRRIDAMVQRVAVAPWGLLVLAVPTAVMLWFMQGWGMDTPDRSLWPHYPALLVYGGFFVLGWLFGRQPEALAGFSRLTVARGLSAIVGIGGTLALAGVQIDPSHPHFDAARVGYVACYALMMWSLVALTLGVFQKLCRRPSPRIRYLADSSYWMYLIHLPVVVWLQVAVAEVALPWSPKLAFVTLATIAVSLVTYDLFVRSTWLGALLNGRRRPRALAWRRRAPELVPTGGEK